jgi:hypothetical protein
MPIAPSTASPPMTSSRPTRRCQARDLAEGAGRIGTGRLVVGADAAASVKDPRGGYRGIDDGLSGFGERWVAGCPGDPERPKLAGEHPPHGRGTSWYLLPRPACGCRQAANRVSHPCEPSVEVTSPSESWNTQAQHPAGRVAIGDGYRSNLPGAMTNHNVIANTIHPAHTGWVVAMDYYGATSFTLIATATCVYCIIGGPTRWSSLSSNVG